MEYLTAKEAAQKWNVSSRMAAYYCNSGKIAGAVKKGKTWLIPASAQKPGDNRCSRNKMKVQDNPELQGAFQRINKMDSDNCTALYHAGDLYKNLGLKRETLRYYEEIGLINPGRNETSQYREFTFADVSRLMAIDFYKKRGFTPLEIRELILSHKYSREELLDLKIKHMENNIRSRQRMVERLKETRTLFRYAGGTEHSFSVRELPSYQVMKTFDAVSSLNEYKERVLASLNLEDEDILSSLVRAVTFDSTGYKGTKMCIVKQTPIQKHSAKRTYLESGKCLYTVLEADSHDDSVMEKMYFAAYEWVSEQNEEFKGVVYIFIRFVELSIQCERNFYEIWIPLK